MATKYKLIYFNVRALGEVSRLIFAVAGVEYEDYRYPIDVAKNFYRPEWDAEKASNPFKYPFGTIPVLEVDGHQIAQSKVIERFLSRRFGLLGSNEFESALLESVVDEISDIKTKWNSLKDTDKQKYFDTELPRYFGYIERLLSKHSGKFIEKESINYADIALWNFLSNHDDQESLSKVLSSFPNIKGLSERVGQNPQITAWVAKRPPSPF